MNTKKPKRVQRKRTKGWRMPENAVYVGRGSKFGNPFTMKGCREAGFIGDDKAIATRCVESFRVWLTTKYWRENWSGGESERARNNIIENIEELRGKDLACWCALDQPCHADVLLELVNNE